jgi:methyltransferase
VVRDAVSALFAGRMGDLDPLLAESFRVLVALHGAFLLALALESFPWRVPADLRTVSCLGVLLLLAGLRYWCISTLGPHWNIRIILVPGAPVIRRGPYRILRHPNYLVVVLEFLFLPLLCRAPITMAVFSVANLLVLRQRIRLEEAALGAFTDFATSP